MLLLRVAVSELLTLDVCPLFLFYEYCWTKHLLCFAALSKTKSKSQWSKFLDYRL